MLFIEFETVCSFQRKLISLSLQGFLFLLNASLSLSAIKVVETTAHRFIYYMKRRRPDIKMTCRYVIT